MNTKITQEALSLSGQKALEAAKSRLRDYLTNMSAPEPVLAILSALNRINPELNTVKTREEVFRDMKERLKVPDNIINNMRDIVGYEYVKQSTAEKNKTLTAYRELVKIVEDIWKDKNKRKNIQPKTSNLKEVKFTKTFIKQIITEELAKLDEASGIEKYLTNKNMNTYGTSDKNQANSIASLVNSIKDMLKQPNISKDDIAKYYTGKVTDDQKNAADKNEEPSDQEAINVIKQIPVTTKR